MDYAQLQELNALFTREIQQERLSDASILVEHQGKVQFTGFYGDAHPESIFNIYSMTKPITAVATMMLMERGVLDLEDPVCKFLPNLDPSLMKTFVTENYDITHAKNIEKTKLGNLVTESLNPIKIRHLLNMTSGLPYPTGTTKVEAEAFEAEKEIRNAFQQGQKLSNIQIATMIAQTPLAFEPGAGWIYGTSADVMGAVIEAATGIPLGEFYDTQIFKPLEMKDTTFHLSEENKNRLAHIYTRKEDGHVEKLYKDDSAEKNIFNPADRFGFEAGGSFLYSTLEDYHKFARMLLNKGTVNGKRFLGRKTVEFMTTDQLTDSQRKMCWLTDEGYGYGNYLRIMKNPEKSGLGSAGEFGWNGKGGTYFLVDPQEELIVVYMQQIREGGDKALQRKFRNIIYSAL